MTKVMIENLSKFEQYGVRLFCILKERVGAEEFASQYWQVDHKTILIDPQFDLYRIIGYQTLM
jgi:hypothetical protein